MQRASTGLRCCYQSLTLARQFRGQRVRHYYVKATKKGPSGQAWGALIGVTATITGVGIFLLGIIILYAVARVKSAHVIAVLYHYRPPRGKYCRP